MNPRVSVIITTIGRKSLKDAIESVENQTYKNWELIIVEDKQRKGGAWALNKGIDQARGQYIAILDDDDVWVSRDKLRMQVNFLDKHKSYIAVGAGKQHGQGKEIKANLIGTPFAHVSMMFRKGLKYNESLKRAKDIDFMIRLNKLGRLGVLDFKVSFKDSSLDKKIEDCYWHRKVILMHKEYKNWIKMYIRLCLREIKLRYYKLKNILLRISGGKEKLIGT